VIALLIRMSSDKSSLTILPRHRVPRSSAEPSVRPGPERSASALAKPCN
jgi:hypothetical protein